MPSRRLSLLVDELDLAYAKPTRAAPTLRSSLPAIREAAEDDSDLASMESRLKALRIRAPAGAPRHLRTRSLPTMALCTSSTERLFGSVAGLKRPILSRDSSRDGEEAAWRKFLAAHAEQEDARVAKEEEQAGEGEEVIEAMEAPTSVSPWGGGICKDSPVAMRKTATVTMEATPPRKRRASRPLLSVVPALAQQPICPMISCTEESKRPRLMNDVDCDALDSVRDQLPRQSPWLRM